ncbi:hypothetical protein ACFL6D_00090 [Spirochaetota bacterium]
MKKMFYLSIFVFISGIIYPFSKTPKQKGSVSGEVLYKGNALNNVFIELKREYRANLNWKNNSFYIPDVPVGEHTLSIKVYDPLYGNFIKKVTNVTVEYFKLIKLGVINVLDEDAVNKNPVDFIANFNKIITIDDFPVNESSLSAIKKDKSIFFAKDYWEDVLKLFGEYLHDYYMENDPLKTRNFIHIEGHASSHEKEGDKKAIQVLSFERAKEVYLFMIDNFRIPKEAFIIYSKADTDMTYKKKPEHDRNRRVEIRFYSETFFY